MKKDGQGQAIMDLAADQTDTQLPHFTPALLLFVPCFSQVCVTAALLTYCR